ncbi:MAG: N-acetyltransferase [Candidatus Roizmanbacteria bacterium]
MEICQLSSSNITEVLDLEKDNAPNKPYYSKYDIEALSFIFDNPKTCKAYGMYDNNILVGWGSYRTQWKDRNVRDGVYEVSTLVVRQSYRRQGIGKQLLHKIVDDIKKNQTYKEIYLTVYPENISALLLYLYNQFVIYNFKKDVYGPGSDRVYLHLKK